LRAVQLLLGHTKLESTVRYLGIEVDDALSGYIRCYEPARACLRDRAQTAGGRRPPDHFLAARRHLPAALRKGADDYGEQQLQWLAVRRHLAR
jgi:hypothetical protein